MMRIIVQLSVLLACTACVHTTDVSSEALEYRRVDYFEAVFLPASQACNRAGGFMIFDGSADGNARLSGLSYADMRMAVARGCAGI